MQDFIQKHHVMSLATMHQETPSVCSVFYVFIPEDNCFVFASEYESEHMQNIMQNADVAAAIHDEQRELSLIKGLQIKGQVTKAQSRHEHLYLNTFPEAKEVKKEIWIVKIYELKYTDNEDIGFGQKEVWKY